MVHAYLAMLIDRYILSRFLANFMILFALLFLFAVAIDLILALERFVDAARSAVGAEASSLATTWMFIRLAVNFESPRFFQFYAYLHGLTAVGAMAFTLAQMHRAKELVAILAAGMSLHRVAMPFVVGVFVLSVVQLVNQEIFLPRVAPLLLRDHGDIGRRGVNEFPIRFTPDSKGSLFQSPSFDPLQNTLTDLTILDRDEQGRTTRRVSAARATWVEKPDRRGWQLTDGVLTRRAEMTTRQADAGLTQPIDFYETDLTPHVLIVRRYGQFTAMLSLNQIAQMLGTEGVAEQPSLRNSLKRYRYSRFAAVLVNVLVMWLTLPTFMLRQPANLLIRSALCAAISMPAMLGAAIFMLADLPGISPAVSVFLPVVVLIPIVLGQWTYIKT